jgi:hypothetical protein
VLGRERDVLEYQVRQTAAGADVLVVAASTDASAIERAVAAELRRLGVQDRR